MRHIHVNVTLKSASAHYFGPMYIVDTHSYEFLFNEKKID
jgi:hypothetical protein